MADTVITPSAYERSDSGAAGWAVAVLILLAIVAFGVFIWPRFARTTPGNASTPGKIDVNVQLPQGQQGNTAPAANSGAQAPAAQ